jgi:hypothetical protein
MTGLASSHVCHAGLGFIADTTPHQPPGCIVESKPPLLYPWFQSRHTILSYPWLVFCGLRDAVVVLDAQR